MGTNSKKAALMIGTFEVYKDQAGDFRFRLKAGNGQVLLASEAYKTKDSCFNGVDTIIKSAPLDALYERKHTQAGRFSFNLQATNGDVVGVSGSYDTPIARDAVVQTVKVFAPTARIKDTTV